MQGVNLSDVFIYDSNPSGRLKSNNSSKLALHLHRNDNFSEGKWISSLLQPLKVSIASEYKARISQGKYSMGNIMNMKNFLKKLWNTVDAFCLFLSLNLIRQLWMAIENHQQEHLPVKEY